MISPMLKVVTDPDKLSILKAHGITPLIATYDRGCLFFYLRMEAEEILYAHEAGQLKVEPEDLYAATLWVLSLLRRVMPAHILNSL